MRVTRKLKLKPFDFRVPVTAGFNALDHPKVTI